MQTYERETGYSRAPEETASPAAVTQRRSATRAAAARTAGPLGRRVRDSFAGQGGERANRTGIPDRMKERFEQSYGYPLDDVQVHYGSREPAKVGALAYTRGNQVHIGPGQEEHLGHELGHVVQQKQGRVAKTTSVGGVPVNDNTALEREADRMGAGSPVAVGSGPVGDAAPQEADAPVQMFVGTAILLTTLASLFLGGMGVIGSLAYRNHQRRREAQEERDVQASNTGEDQVEWGFVDGVRTEQSEVSGMYMTWEEEIKQAIRQAKRGEDDDFDLDDDDNDPDTDWLNEDGEDEATDRRKALREELLEAREQRDERRRQQAAASQGAPQGQQAQGGIRGFFKRLFGRRAAA